MIIRRSNSNKLIGGVCSGIAKELNIPVIRIRIAFILAVILAGLSIWFYLIAWIIMPSDY